MINILLSNGYPLDFIFKIMCNRIKSLISLSHLSSPPSPEVSFSSSLSPSPSFFVIPFKGISNHLIPSVNNINKNLAFLVENKLNKFIKIHKDPLPRGCRSNVVYRLQ